MRFWIVEDLKRIRDHFRAEIAAKAPGVEVIDLPSSEEAKASAARIADEDVVSLDSQLPMSAGEPHFDNNAGVRVAAMIRAGGKRCHLFWHSTASFPEEIRSWGGIKKSVVDIVDAVVSLARMPSPAAVPPDARERARIFLRKMEGHSRSLVALDILCIGAMTGVGSGGKADDWFSLGFERLRAQVATSPGFWTELGEGDSDAKIREAVATVHGFYDRAVGAKRLDAVPVAEMTSEAQSLHEAFKKLWPRSWL